MEPGSIYSLDGPDWEMKDFVGLDWVWRDSVKPDTRDNRWWRPATVPGSVLHDLWRQGAVPDPYFERNSLLVEWVPDRSWVFRKRFTLSADQIAQLDHADPAVESRTTATLVFQGIDYAGEIFLNGTSLGCHEGMFVPFAANVTRLLCEGDNLVAVALDPAPAEQPQVGRTSLTRTMKSRMTYWWDFCPRMIHVGLWDHVFIEWSGPVRLQDIRLQADIQSSRDTGRSTADLTLAASCSNADGCLLRATVTDPETGVSQSAEGTIDVPTTELVWHLDPVKLWQPNGRGIPFEYEIQIELFLPGNVISDRRSLMYGLRTIDWLPNQGAPADGHPFILTVNGIPTLIKGYNWVPLDVLYGVERPEKLRHLLRLAREAGVNLLRVWGGGLIEKGEFYRACAENGILVWQEFPFSSSGIDNKTPEDPLLLAGFQKQAIALVRHRRNQTALAVWCGGNELTAGPERPLDKTDPLLAILDRVIQDEDPQRRFLPTSPSGGVFSHSLANLANCPDQLMDVHGPWEHQGLAAHYALYNRGTARLHSEFGVEGMTNAASLNATIAAAHQMPADKDNPIYFHRGSWWNHEALVQEIFQNLDQIDQIRQASQYLQYEGLKYALERNRARAFRCGGSLPWQFNEPYPNAYCTSSVDYFGRPKPGYHAARAAYAPVHVAASFVSSSLAGRDVLELGLDVCGSEANGSGLISGTSEVNGSGLISGIPDGNSSRLLSDSATESPCQSKPLSLIYQLAAMDGQLVDAGTIPCQLPINGSFHAGDVTLRTTGSMGDLLLLRLRLQDQQGNRIAVNEYLFTRSTHFHELFTMKNAHLEGVRQGNNLLVANPSPVAALWINIQDAEPLTTPGYVYASLNYFCLLPGERHVIRIERSDDSPDGRQLLLEGFNCRQHVF